MNQKYYDVIGFILKFAIGAIVKNEADSILEWVAYHWVVGIDHFFIADNGSNDGTYEILKGLEKQGFVTVFRFPTLGTKAPQLLAYKKIIKLSKGLYTAVAFIDADEYLVPMDESDNVKLYLTQWFSKPDTAAVAMNWACFGSSGEIFRRPELVIERFKLRFSEKRNQNHHFKTIVRPEKVEIFYNPHMVKLKSGNYLNVLGEKLVAHPKQTFGLSDKVIWYPVRVNHYVVKSLEEFLVRKSPAGSAATIGKEKHQRYFITHDHNDSTCEVAAMIAPKVRIEMNKMAEGNVKYLQPSLLYKSYTHLKVKLIQQIGLLRWWWLR